MRLGFPISYINFPRWFTRAGYVTHKSWRPLITLMYAAEWLLCARFGFQGREMQPMRFVSCVVCLGG